MIFFRRNKKRVYLHWATQIDFFHTINNLVKIEYEMSTIRDGQSSTDSKSFTDNLKVNVMWIPFSVEKKVYWIDESVESICLDFQEKRGRAVESGRYYIQVPKALWHRISVTVSGFPQGTASSHLIYRYLAALYIDFELCVLDAYPGVVCACHGVQRK